MLRFEKWEGLGNDFILVEAEVAALQVRSLCDRHTGVGADGVLVLGAVDGLSCRMIVLNADGSRPEMCGNGLRCVAGYLMDRAGAESGEVVVATDAGPRRCKVERQPDGSYRVAADMGVAVVGEPLDLAAAADRAQSGRLPTRPFTAVSVGNPHAVSFAPFVSEDVDELGPVVDRLVPGGTNVELCQVADGGKRLEVAVWERGVGRTRACGTGACAAAAAAAAAGRVPFDEPVDVALAGGVLEIVVARQDGALTMTGLARRVFVGETHL